MKGYLPGNDHVCRLGKRKIIFKRYLGGLVSYETFACTLIWFHFGVHFLLTCRVYVDSATTMTGRVFQLPPSKKSANHGHLDLRPMKAMFRWWICCWFLSPSGEGGSYNRKKRRAKGRMDHFFNKTQKHVHWKHIIIIVIVFIQLYRKTTLPKIHICSRFRVPPPPPCHGHGHNINPPPPCGMGGSWEGVGVIQPTAMQLVG